MKKSFVVEIIFICFFLISCANIKNKININRNGSGTAKLEITISEILLSLDPTIIPNIKNEMTKRGWQVIKEEKNNIVVEMKFKNISQLNDEYMQWTFFSKKKGFLTRLYFLEIELIESKDLELILYEIYIKMPGNIDETNGIKISSSEVKWNLTGLSKGAKLFVKSSDSMIFIFILPIVLIVGIILLFVIIIINRKKLGSVKTMTDNPI